MPDTTPAAPELLSPAGTLKHLRYAFAYGADAVYAGQPRYSLRVRNNSFKNEAALAEGIAEARARANRSIWPPTSARTTTRYAATCATWRRSSSCARTR
ncbi:hypothetical protein ASALC70_03034 [Alcanivorax sp. ALC70]|nr:hypothetical protein ASALC70_03034 [Alcanivorax sp. ALC70]